MNHFINFLVISSTVFCASNLLADAKADQEKLTAIMKEFHDEMTFFGNDKGHYIVRLKKKRKGFNEYPLASLYWSPDGVVFHPIEEGASEGTAEKKRLEIYDNHHTGNQRKAELIEETKKILLNCGADIVGGGKGISSGVCTGERFVDIPNQSEILAFEQRSTCWVHHFQGEGRRQ